MTDTNIAASALQTILAACGCAAPPDGEPSDEAQSILFQARVATTYPKDFPTGWIHSLLTH